MHTQTIHLYDHFALPHRPDQGGVLRCWQGEEGCRPAVLILPGGGYGHISLRESEPVAAAFGARGWDAFVLEYSVHPAPFPTQLRQAAWAMRYIRREAGPAMVAAVGFSAGGHLCGTLGTMFDAPEVADIAPPELLRPDALGLCYPVAVSWGATHQASFQRLCGEDEELKARLSLDKLVRADMPPTFLWATRDDGSVPCRNAILLAQELDRAGVDFAFHLYRHGRHGLSTADAQLFPQGDMGPVSWDVAGWVESMSRFFVESGASL